LAPYPCANKDNKAEKDCAKEKGYHFLIQSFA
jgi:hypothetical protein